MDRHIGELAVSGGGQGKGEARGRDEVYGVRWPGRTMTPGSESTLALAGCMTSKTDSPQLCLQFLIFNTEKQHPPHWSVKLM